MTLENPLSSKFSSLRAITKRYFRREVIPRLADLRLAIALLLVIAFFSAFGTVIEQGETLRFYQANYPERPALFGFLTWKVILILGLDHVYRTWWFLALLIMFGSSLTACTFKRQIPALRWFSRTWNFYTKPSQFEKLALRAEFIAKTLDELVPLLEKRRYRVFRRDNSIYARKGIVGRIGPIIVHIAILMVLVGALAGAMTRFVAQEMVASGETFQVQNILDAGPWAQTQIPKDWSVKVNRFWIDYTPEGTIDQFYSDLSVLNNDGNEVKRKTIHVNEPLRYRGVTMYQADWAIAAIRLQFNKSPVLKLPMVQLDTGGRGRLWGTWVPTKPDLSEGISMIVKDLQGTVLVYGNDGTLLTTLRQGMTTEINGVTLAINEVVGSTGLQIKADPSIPIVYAGFGLLMLGVIMSYVSHSQIWALQEDLSGVSPEEIHFYIGGQTNRAQVAFEREMIEMLDQLSQPTNS